MVDRADYCVLCRDAYLMGPRAKSNAAFRRHDEDSRKAGQARASIVIDSVEIREKTLVQRAAQQSLTPHFRGRRAAKFRDELKASMVRLAALVAASPFADDSSAGDVSKVMLPIKVPSNVESGA